MRRDSPSFREPSSRSDPVLLSERSESKNLHTDFAFPDEGNAQDPSTAQPAGCFAQDDTGFCCPAARAGQNKEGE